MDAGFTTEPDFRPRWQGLLVALLPVAFALALLALFPPGPKPRSAPPPAIRR